MPVTTVEDMRARIGQDIGRSDWILVDQPTINLFADATGDHQFIHVDPERARDTPFGGTIAHGFLVLSLLATMLEGADLPRPEGISMGVNYGFDRVRFLAPVRSGSRVRAHFVLAAFDEKRPGQFQQQLDCTIEVEGAEKPALKAAWITQLFV